MKKVILSILMLLAFTASSVLANNSNTTIDERVKVSYIDEFNCTVTYTNSHGVTFSATADTCTEAYENILPFIEAQ